MCGIINRKNNLKTAGTLIHGNGILYSSEPNLNTTEIVLFLSVLQSIVNGAGKGKQS